MGVRRDNRRREAKRDVSSLVIEIRSLLAGVGANEMRILELLEGPGREMQEVRAAFQEMYGIGLEELLLSGFSAEASAKARLLRLLYPVDSAQKAYEVYLGLSGRFTPIELMRYLDERLAGGIDVTSCRFRTPETLVEVAKIFERWYGPGLHPENPSLTYAVWYELENHQLLHPAMLVIDSCMAAVPTWALASGSGAVQEMSETTSSSPQQSDPCKTSCTPQMLLCPRRL